MNAEIILSQARDIVCQNEQYQQQISLLQQELANRDELISSLQARLITQTQQQVLNSNQPAMYSGAYVSKLKDKMKEFYEANKYYEETIQKQQHNYEQKINQMRVKNDSLVREICIMTQELNKHGIVIGQADKQIQANVSQSESHTQTGFQVRSQNTQTDILSLSLEELKLDLAYLQLVNISFQDQNRLMDEMIQQQAQQPVNVDQSIMELKQRVTQQPNNVFVQNEQSVMNSIEIDDSLVQNSFYKHEPSVFNPSTPQKRPPPVEPNSVERFPTDLPKKPKIKSDSKKPETSSVQKLETLNLRSEQFDKEPSLLEEEPQLHPLQSKSSVVNEVKSLDAQKPNMIPITKIQSQQLNPIQPVKTAIQKPQNKSPNSSASLMSNPNFLDSFDKPRNSLLSFQEAKRNLKSNLSDDTLHYWFDKIDENKNGEINMGQFSALMKIVNLISKKPNQKGEQISIHDVLERKGSEVEIVMRFAELDRNGDGLLEMEEFDRF
ncbi:EF-hand_domain pair [Hexamita inflata]|uniref:EF-hand domain pair n=1 Tax=Hexamita inflata TaxID=28002 RepID=A0AA86TN94_9EUKA|nr:EF-hand domain pair [Hexamita inflata]